MKGLYARVVYLASVILIAFALSAYADSPPAGVDPAKRLQDTKQELIAAYKRALETLDSDYRVGTVSADDVAVIRRHQLAATLNARLPRDDTVTLLRQQLDLARQSLASADARLEGGRCSETDLNIAKAICEEIEVKLAEQTDAQPIDSKRPQMERIRAESEGTRFMKHNTSQGWRTLSVS